MLLLCEPLPTQETHEPPLRACTLVLDKGQRENMGTRIYGRGLMDVLDVLSCSGHEENRG